jgi:hypothetical protein
VDEATRVIERLQRIERLERDEGAGIGSASGRLLGELRALVAEAEAWARLEGDVRACSAVSRLREEAEGMS